MNKRIVRVEVERRRPERDELYFNVATGRPQTAGQPHGPLDAEQDVILHVLPEDE